MQRLSHVLGLATIAISVITARSRAEAAHRTPPRSARNKRSVVNEGDVDREIALIHELQASQHVHGYLRSAGVDQGPRSCIFTELKRPPRLRDRQHKPVEAGAVEGTHRVPPPDPETAATT